MDESVTTVARPKPMAIRRGDHYAVINIPDLDELEPGQRVGIAILVWEQVKTLMEINGEDTVNPRNVDVRVAAALNCGWSSVTTARYAMSRDGWKYLDDLVEGRIKTTPFLHKSGMKKGAPRLRQGPIEAGKDGVLYFGKGDRFDDATEPLYRYLAAWRKKGFEFRHLPPKEARRRLPRIRELIANLQATERDLEMRSHSATLRAPTERKEKHQ